MSERSDREITQDIIDTFHSRFTEFAISNGMNLESEKIDGDGVHWFYYSLTIRPDLPRFDLEFVEEKDTLSYCTDFREEFLKVKESIFGLKRLVIFPYNDDTMTIPTPKRTWHFFGTNGEMERFFDYLIDVKKYAKKY
ncbi:TPA: hypothetical protein PC505_004079 [Morganella morganii]|nr:hypothetical protein [Morganella morganii]HDF2366514.1 hypothetical protein [Morganella morganii]HDF2424612.1 hypothetical protein [Morganella morganii]